MVNRAVMIVTGLLVAIGSLVGPGVSPASADVISEVLVDAKRPDGTMQTRVEYESDCIRFYGLNIKILTATARIASDLVDGFPPFYMNIGIEPHLGPSSSVPNIEPYSVSNVIEEIDGIEYRRTTSRFAFLDEPEESLETPGLYENVFLSHWGWERRPKFSCLPSTLD